MATYFVKLDIRSDTPPGARHRHSQGYGYSEQQSKCQWCRGWSTPIKEKAAAVNAAQAYAVCAPVQLRGTPECLHSVLRSIARWIPNVLVPGPAAMEKQK